MKTEIPNTIAAATFQLWRDDLKCSRLRYAPLSHAICDPLTPNQILIPILISPKKGAIIPNPITVTANERIETTSCTKET